jgi:Asp-tRNA(Asn)/Glu-tRNA(Gln) amidotransferase A subunit family amidase
MGRQLTRPRFLVVRLASAVPDFPLYYPYVAPPAADETAATETLAAFSLKSLDVPVDADTFRRWTIADYTSRYASGELSPVQVARAVLDAVAANEASATPLKLFVEIHAEEVLDQARASAARYARGEPQGVLDGVPVAIKDEMAVKGFKMTTGTSFLGDIMGVATSDDLPVRRLRAAGAMIVGTTNMHEIGSGVTGYNMHYGTVRNPYDTSRHTGGSSSGSAAAVSSGLVPLAVGIDGGGSIRIPSALCGVVGIKPTFQRVPPMSPDCPSVAHIGPIAGNVRDAAIGLAVLGGEGIDGAAIDNDDDMSVYLGFRPGSLANTPVPRVIKDVAAFENTLDLKGVRIGHFPELTNHSSPEVGASVRRALDSLVKRGAELVETPLGHLTAIHMAHSLTISSEFAQNLDKYFSRYGEMSPEVQVVLTFGRSFSAMDFLAAQRVRAFALRQFREQVLSKVDVFASPSVGITAPEIPPEAHIAGAVNAAQMDAIMRFSWYGDLIGVPGVSVPIGVDAHESLPLAIQFQADHWDEDRMLRVAHAVEVEYAREQKPPQVFFDVIGAAKTKDKTL